MAQPAAPRKPLLDDSDKDVLLKIAALVIVVGLGLLFLGCALGATVGIAMLVFRVIVGIGT